MFPSKFPWLHAIHIAAICGVIGFTVLFTGNALALFALLVLWSPPPLIAGGDDEETEAVGNPIGFGNGE